jgi:von Hippel-Lindau disease tumor suppressor protein
MIGKKLALVAVTIVLGASAAQAAGRRCSEERSLRSHDSKLATQVTFLNTSSESARVYWLNYQGRREFYKALRPGESFTQDTYATHPWVATDADENCLEVYMPQPRPSTLRIH